MSRTVAQEILPPLGNLSEKEGKAVILSTLNKALQTTTETLEGLASKRNEDGIAIAINIRVTPIKDDAPNRNRQAAPPAPRREGVKAEAVERIISRCIKQRSGLFPGRYYNRLVHMATLPDGTAVAVVEDPETGVRHHWTVCPTTFEPKRLGFANS